MGWKSEVTLELARGNEAFRQGNAGRARTCARRAAGAALSAWIAEHPEKTYGRDMISQIRSLAADPIVPADVRAAADRLQTRLAADFSSPSTSPLEDARVIIEYLHKHL